MLREEIIEKISKYFKLTSFEAEKIYNDIFSIIVAGVKQDNIVDVANFGEFIIKYNKDNGDQNSSAYNKTVEFLATSRLEDEINSAFSDQGTTSTGLAGNIPTMIPPVSENSDPVQVNKTVPESTFESKSSSAGSSNQESSSVNPVEEEMRKKREEIINRMNRPVEENTEIFESGVKKTEKIQPEKTEESPVLPQNLSDKNIQDADNRLDDKASEYTRRLFEYEDTKKSDEELVEKNEIVEKTPETVVDKKSETDEDLSKQSFSDYFTTVNQQKTETPEVTREPELVEEHIEQKKVDEPLQHVIPPSVVELHNEITHTTPRNENMSFPVVDAPSAGSVSTNGNGNGSVGEYHASDNSYYIWYKDVETNVTDTQNLSYEYELLYQATKEAEYKSKLKIYVTTFILFFSVVLILLIFSPVIYKLFFKPVEAPPTNTEQVQTEQPQNNEENTQQNTQQEPANNTNVTPPVNQQETQTQTTKQETQTQPTKQETQTQTQPKQETQTQPKQETQTQPTKQETQQQTPTSESKIDGVTKNSMGWMDDKFKVIYIKLDNGKFTIQESAWDSDSKASKRISTVSNYNISGLKGSVFKVDLGDKGTWFRARFGEFTSLEEARVKAEELRNKERMRLQASLLFFLLTA